MPRELSQCRKWEKERRIRLNECFNKLEKKLPTYDPSINVSRPEILARAVKYIEELQEKINTALTADADNNPERAEIKNLQKRVNYLLTRNEQLSSLLKDAKISVPTECGGPAKMQSKKWSQKISLEKANELAKLESQKENDPKKVKKVPDDKLVIKSKPIVKKKVKKAVRLKKAKVEKGNSSVIVKSNGLNAGQKIVSIANLQPCYFIANSVPSNLQVQTGCKANTVVTNSNLLSSPILSTTVKTPTIITKTNTFPTGTIILANTLPLVQTPTIINPPIILNAAPTNTLIVVKSNQPKNSTVNLNPIKKTPANTSSSVPKTFKQPTIFPKRNITKTTHINKVPIPASRYASNYILPPAPQTKIVRKKNVVKKAEKRKASEENEANDVKKAKLDDDCNKDNQGNKKSDYSIDALCKEKEKSCVDDKEKSSEKETEPVKEKAMAEKPNEKVVEEEVIIEPKPVNEEKDTVEKPAEISKPEEVTKPDKEPTETIKEKSEMHQEISELAHSEFSNDIFASLVTTGSQNPESTSPTAAFLNAFPLVSSFTGIKATEVIEEEASNSPHDTPTLLQIGTMDSSKPTQTPTDSLTPSLLNLDQFSFFTSKDICSSLYSSIDGIQTTFSNENKSKNLNVMTKTAKILYENAISDTENLKSPKVIENMVEKNVAIRSYYAAPIKKHRVINEAVVNVSNNVTGQTLAPLNNLPVNVAKTSDSIDLIHYNNSVQTNVSCMSQAKIQSNLCPIAVPIDKFKTNLPAVNNLLPIPNNSMQAIMTNNLNLHQNIPAMPVINENSAQRNKIPTQPHLNAHKSNHLQQNVNQRSENIPAINDSMSHSTSNLPRINANLSHDINPQIPFNARLSTSQTINPTQNTNRSLTNYNEPKKAVNIKEKYTNYNISEYNTFNPFTDLPKSTSYSYVSTKSYNQPVYSNNSNCNYNYQPDFNTNYKNLGKNYVNYETYDNNQYNYYNHVKPNKMKANENVPRAPVNWMTAPDHKQQELIVPPFAKEADFVPNIYTSNTFITNAQTTYFNATAPTYATTDIHNSFSDVKKPDMQFNNAFQRNDVEEHQFAWSPTKIPQLLDPPHNFVSTTLPTLVGDLALGNTNYLDKNKSKMKDRRNIQQNYESSTNFLSVSQLVDQNKVDPAARVIARRNSGGRSNKTSSKAGKRTKPDKESGNLNAKIKNYEPNVDWLDSKRVKQPPSSYSAEALIGHPTQAGNNVNKHRQQQNYSKTIPGPSFLSDNLIPYFPPVEIQPDNNFNQQNQNYQTNFTPSFPSSIQSNTFIPNSTTTYLPSSNFEISDFNPLICDNIFSHSNQKTDKQFTKTNSKTPTKQGFNNITTTPKKNKKKAVTDSTSFVDFSFLSMPGAINSPILPDDFHTHSNFLPPPPNQLYPCKNPLYPKQSGDLSSGLLPLPPVTRTNIQHPEISPSLNNVGTSLTNFNLSTIFPEMNKSSDMYLDSSKNKDYSLQRTYLPTTNQIPFTKAPIYNIASTQSFPT